MTSTGILNYSDDCDGLIFGIAIVQNISLIMGAVCNFINHVSIEGSQSKLQYLVAKEARIERQPLGRSKYAANSKQSPTQ